MKPAMKVLLFFLALSILSIMAIYQYNKPQSVAIGELSIVQNGSHCAYVVDFWHGKKLEKVAYQSIEEMNAAIYKISHSKRYIITFIDLTKKDK